MEVPSLQKICIKAFARHIDRLQPRLVQCILRNTLEPEVVMKIMSSSSNWNYQAASDIENAFAMSSGVNIKNFNPDTVCQGLKKEFNRIYRICYTKKFGSSKVPSDMNQKRSVSSSIAAPSSSSASQPSAHDEDVNWRRIYEEKMRTHKLEMQHGKEVIRQEQKRINEEKKKKKVKRVKVITIEPGQPEPNSKRKKL